MKTLLTYMLIGCFSIAGNAVLGQSKDELAKQLANPIASLISVPFQNNFHYGVGVNSGFKYSLNMQPVIPVSVGSKWNMISRTIIPIVYQKNVISDNSSQSGIGDIVQSLFFSPKAPTKNGIIWGVGPVLLFPTASKSEIGLEKWGAGPTALVLKASSKWTYGLLVNHIFSYAGNESRDDINASFFQPFISRMLGKGLSLSLASENTQNWKHDHISGFAGIFANKVLNIGNQTLQVGGGPKLIYSNKTDSNFGFRVNIVLLLPKG